MIPLVHGRYVSVIGIIRLVKQKKIQSPNTHPLNRDHLAMQFSPVQVADTLGGLVCGRHGDEAVAAGARTLSVGHHLSANNLQDREMNEVNNSTNTFMWPLRCVSATYPAIFAEEGLQISRSGSGGETTDPQIPATARCGTTSGG